MRKDQHLLRRLIPNSLPRLRFPIHRDRRVSQGARLCPFQEDPFHSTSKPWRDLNLIRQLPPPWLTYCNQSPFSSSCKDTKFHCGEGGCLHIFWAETHPVQFKEAWLRGTNLSQSKWEAAQGNPRVSVEFRPRRRAARGTLSALLWEAAQPPPPGSA